MLWLLFFLLPVFGGLAFLVGGNNGQRQVTTVAKLRLVAG